MEGGATARIESRNPGWTGAVELADGTRITTDDGRYRFVPVEEGGAVQGRFVDGEGVLDFEFHGTPEVISLRVTNRSAAALALGKIEVLRRRLPHDGTPGQVLPNGLHSWQGIDVYPLEVGAAARDCWWTIALEEPPVAAGFLTARHAVGRFRVEADEEAVTLTAWQEISGALLPPGATRECDPLFFSMAPEPLAEMERFAKMAAEANGARLRHPNRATWCSWYAGWIREGMYEYKDGLEAGVLDNIPRVASLFGRRGAGAMRIVDDSDAMPYGDWDDRTKAVPGGFDALVARMQEHHVTPGIWLPVYWVSDRSRLFHDHPDWLGRNEKGDIKTSNLYGNTCAFLDSSHPAVLRHFEDLAHGLRERGFRYVMTDFLVHGTEPTGYLDETASKGEVHRRGLEALRRGFGEDTYWLGCGALLGSSMGLVDGMRISGDSFGDRPYSYLQAGARWFYNRRLWRNDPDAIVCRGKSVEWNRAWMSWMALSGSVLTYGDTFDDLGEEHVDAYRRIFPPLDIAGRPLDLWENDPYLLWGVVLGDGARRSKLLGLFHFDDPGGFAVQLNLDEIEARIDSFRATPDNAPAGYLLWDFWNEELLEVPGAVLELPLPDRAGRVFALRHAVGHPQLLGTDGHFSMGTLEVPLLAWNDVVHALVGTVKGNGGDAVTLFFHVPPGFALAGIELDGAAVDAVVREDRVLALPVPAAAEPLAFRITFTGEGEAISPRPFVSGRAATETVPGMLTSDPAAVARLRTIARRTPLGYRLVDYLDCGRGEEVLRVPRLHLQRLRGERFAWPDAAKVGSPSAATVLFDEEEIVFDLVDLDPARAYQLGYTWWDYDANGRVQSILLRTANGDLTLVDRARLPAWGGHREGPESTLLRLPPGTYAEGTARLVVRRDAGAHNAVLSELWLVEER